MVCDAVVVTIGHPTVVDQYSREVFENSHVVHGRGDVDMGVRFCSIVLGRDERFVNDVHQGFAFDQRVATGRLTKFALTTSTGCISA